LIESWCSNNSNHKETDVHEISGYGIGNGELAAWRDARHSTLIFAPRGDVVLVTLLGDDRLLGRHSIPATHFAEVLASYARFWHEFGAIARSNERSLVTAFAGTGQGSDTSVPGHTPPKGFPNYELANALVHVQVAAFVGAVTESVR
jgi:hypothetical protein